MSFREAYRLWPGIANGIVISDITGMINAWHHVEGVASYKVIKPLSKFMIGNSYGNKLTLT